MQYPMQSTTLFPLLYYFFYCISAMNQEKQELLCLMELTQKNQAPCCTKADCSSSGTLSPFVSSSSMMSLNQFSTRNNPTDYHLSAAELSVLGACNCGTSHAQPCRCAWTLVNSRREVAHLQNRVSTVGRSCSFIDTFQTSCLRFIKLKIQI